MSEPIIVQERHAVKYVTEDQVWTYDKILKLFPDGDGSLVNPLLRRCQEYESEIERLRAELQKLLDAAGQANTWLFQGTTWDVDGRARVACALNGVLCEIYAAKAAGGDDE